MRLARLLQTGTGISVPNFVEIGQPVRRTEDQRFLSGAGQYTDDICLPNQAYLYFFRSPYPHGKIINLGLTEALTVPGVIAVYTEEDLTTAGIQDIVGRDIPASSLTPYRAALKQPPLARDRVRYVGEPVAAIVAESVSAARDAAELVSLEVEELVASPTIGAARSNTAISIHDGVPGNSYGIREYGKKDKTDLIFDNADHVISLDVVNNRVAPTTLEPRGCNMQFDGTTLTVYQGCQGAHILRDRLSQSIKLSPDDIHVISPDVGGAFGLKFFLQCESVVAAHAAMDTRRPIKWIADRNESFLADLHGRDHRSRGELALDSNGRIHAMRAMVLANLGAYCSQAGSSIPWFGACMSTGCYDIAAAYVTVEMVVTNTVPVDAYRGAGRPEASYLIERLIDKAARCVGLTQAEIRRRNFIKPSQFPYETTTGVSYDSGEYEHLMERALDRADWAGFEARRKQSEAEKRLRGIGMSYYVEICSTLGSEMTSVRIEKNGRVTALVGTQASGQGHQTTYAQILAAKLNIDISLVDIVQGNTELIPNGQGTIGSRSMALGGSSLILSIDSMIKSGHQMAAVILKSAISDIVFANGEFTIPKTGRMISLKDVAAASWVDKNRPDTVQEGLFSSESFEQALGTFPNGCHICELEINPETGETKILRYTIEDDLGIVLNPLILEGQIIGGVAQGLGQARGEHAIYDEETGQLVTATLMDYPLPRADCFPAVDFQFQEIRSPRNPLGVKGAGEAGTVGSPPAYINALLDALSRKGITDINMPATPHKIWALLNQK